MTELRKFEADRGKDESVRAISSLSTESDIPKTIEDEETHKKLDLIIELLTKE